MMDLTKLGDGLVRCSELPEILGVTIGTINKWFRGTTVSLPGITTDKFIPMDDFIDFIVSYRDGKYIRDMVENIEEPLDDMSDDAAAMVILNCFLGKFRLYTPMECTGMTEEDIKEIRPLGAITLTLSLI